MSSSTLDLSAFKKGIAQLGSSLVYFHSDVVQQDPGLVVHMRAAAIQAFEFTYELSWKMLKRYLELSEANPQEIDGMSFPDLIRIGCERGLLLSELKVWKEFRRERSITSHTYDESKATDIFNNIPLFLSEAKYLLAKLEERTVK